MRILLVHRYFWPDTPPYATLLLEIAKKLRQDGHQVEVFTSYPSYKSHSTYKDTQALESINGIQIKRIRVLSQKSKSLVFKLLDMVYFPLRVIAHILRRRNYDLVMCSTAPAVLMGLSVALGTKWTNARFFYHCMDLHPEVGKISGEFKNPLIFRLLMRLDSWTCRSAQAVIVLSRDMRDTLRERPRMRPNIKIINNFPLPHTHDSDGAEAFPEQYQKSPNKFRVLFAGNVGRFQNLESFIDAMKLLEREEPIELVFLGEGAALNMLKAKTRELGLSNILFIPHQNVSVARKLMSEADLGVVSLQRGVYKFAFPSKTMTYLEEGCPILLSVEAESELNEMVVDNNIGFATTPGDSASIADAILCAFRSNISRQSQRRTCLEFVDAHYSQSKLLDQWSSLFNDQIIDKQVTKHQTSS